VVDACPVLIAARVGVCKQNTSLGSWQLHMLPDSVCKHGMHHVVESAVTTSAVFVGLWTRLLVWALSRLMTCKRYHKYHCACRSPKTPVS